MIIICLVLLCVPVQWWSNQLVCVSWTLPAFWSVTQRDSPSLTPERLYSTTTYSRYIGHVVYFSFLPFALRILFCGHIWLTIPWGKDGERSKIRTSLSLPLSLFFFSLPLPLPYSLPLSLPFSLFLSFSSLSPPYRAWRVLRIKICSAHALVT